MVLNKMLNSVLIFLLYLEFHIVVNFFLLFSESTPFNREFEFIHGLNIGLAFLDAIFYLFELGGVQEESLIIFGY
jgi:hypothetical protein